VIRFLGTETGLAQTGAVADVGSGTGIFTRLLLDTGATVFAVEPNDSMRGAAEAEFRARGNFRSVKGTAEATGLGDRTISLVTCAQAFHWFEPAGARREFSRILVRGGWCAVVWNTRVVGGSGFSAGYDGIAEEFGTDSRRVRHENIAKTGRFDGFFGAGNWETREFDNFQTLDFGGLKGRLLSSSYAPKEGHPRHGPMIAALKALFERFQRDGLVRMDYRTELFLGRLA
jgi:SAM-dependent methyltransferase